ncbi:nitrile hydratase subunit beta [Pukyongiella litopenaei]|uniref:nitrile hydratase n=1 Tax=Pukyongiella litopenaei TaxID=2605946 RepID=A0A2S0MKX9_9RHOB|nr:nitrile hydratase subunit beta [Pukyongiella litopenaei]AVO36487.1 nitrile hydratase subunit beta [Pukyongiella litopenaei]
MTRVHDMGGRFGDGPVRPDPEQAPVFAADWHARALAVTLAAGALGRWTLDESRHARECLSPADYTRFSYYEKWIAALADLLVAKGVLSRDDLTGHGGGGAHPLAGRRLAAENVARTLARGGPADRDAGPGPVFEAGQAVRALRPAANRLVEGGHTRLPAYAAGAQGYVLRCHGNHVLPDSNAHGLGEAPEPLYSVRFKAAQLWAAPEHPDDEVILDLWQSYLEPA